MSASFMAKLQTLGVGQIADVMGRYYAMDRDQRWNRLQRAYNAVADGEGHFIPIRLQAIQASYDAGVTDEFMEPVDLHPRGELGSADDSVIFFNFRPDRARELTRALVDPAFAGLKRPRGCFPLHFVCTTEYDATMPNVTVAFPHEKLEKHLWGIPQPAGPHPAAHRRDGKIRPRHLLLQRRAGGGLPRGGPVPDPLPQGGHLRSPTGDECPCHHRRSDPPDGERQV